MRTSRIAPPIQIRQGTLLLVTPDGVVRTLSTAFCQLSTIANHNE